MEDIKISISEPKKERINKDYSDIIQCSEICDKCDVKYPKFPQWQLCGYSFINLDGSILCRNKNLIKKLLEEQESNKV